RADVFSLGCVLFECLAGQAAFTAEHPVALLAKVLLDEPPALRDLRPALPDALVALVERLLAKDPEARPADGDAVADALDALAAIEGDGRPAAAASPRAATRTPALTTDEQRIVSVVVALAHPDPGEVARAATLHPADAGRASAGLRADLEPLGVSLAELADGSLVAMVPGRGAATDQASRAARVALALRARHPAAPMALCTGRALVSGRLPVGEVLDRAAALLRRAAPTRAVLLDELSAGLLDPSFDVGGGPDGLELRGERAHADGARTLLGRATPCVGRERDLEALARTFDECAAEPVARAVIVTGPPGVGKSRLRRELLSLLAARGSAFELWQARGDALGTSAPLGLAARLVRRAARIGDGDPPALRRQKLRARAARHFGGAELSRTAAFLGELVEAPFPDEEDEVLRTARAQPRLMADQMRAAWLDLLQADLAARPVLLVLDDLHWSDQPSVELVGDALRRLYDRPLLVLALGRPQLDDLFPGLWRERHPQRLPLSPLTRKACERLARAVLGDATAPALVERLAERSAGNAFFLEELLRAAAAGRADEVPDTVLAMVQARLAELPEELRRTLRAASIFGRSFQQAGTAALLGGDDFAPEVGARLTDLAALELVEPRAALPGGAAGNWSFRHALVRDAAHAMLTEADRVHGHRLAAAWLEQAGETDAALLADHWERGGEPDRALPWHARAAHEAFRRFDARAALTRAARALACGAQGDERGRLLLLISGAHGWRGEYASAEARAQEALAALPHGTPDWFRAVDRNVTASGNLGHDEPFFALVRELRNPALAAAAVAAPETARARVASLAHAAQEMSWRQGRAAESLALLQEAERAAAALPPDTFLQASIHSVRGMHALFAEDTWRGLQEALAAADCFERVGHLRNVGAQRANAAHAYLNLGMYEDAERLMRGVLETMARLGVQRVEVTARQNLALALAGRGALEEARAVLLEAVRVGAESDEILHHGSVRCDMAKVLLRTGDLEGAEREARAGLAYLPPGRVLRPGALTTLATVQLRRGRAAEALETVEQTLAIPEVLERMGGEETMLRLVQAEALEALGRAAEARRELSEARARLLARAARVENDAARASMLSRVPENARLLALAAAWLDGGTAA
ncbi:MAG TPA: AAA family ATPase, partial [Myxococcota bacterium]|nr:AAA family ATPase [Myxococcota bacterium]